MTDYFFDSSGLVKRYIKEVGNLWVTQVIEDRPNNRILVARITETESNSAFARLVREKIWTNAEATLQRKQLRKHFRHEYSVIGITIEVVQQAINSYICIPCVHMMRFSCLVQPYPILNLFNNSNHHSFLFQAINVC